MPVNVTGLTPILWVNSVPASIACYVEKLGFRKCWDWPADAGEATFACVARGEACLFLCKQGQGSPGTWMSIFVDDVDALHEEFKASGATILMAPTDRPWGMREMHVTDLDQHVIRFGHGIEAAPQPVKRADPR